MLHIRLIGTSSKINLNLLALALPQLASTQIFNSSILLFFFFFLTTRVTVRFYEVRILLFPLLYLEKSQKT